MDRRYASSVERALAVEAREWPDYISFLSRLMKAIQAHPAGAGEIPHSAGVATKLSQCISPSLPSGVHQKALEVYSYIFTVVGRDILAQDLPIYLPALATTMSFASMSVRASFLTLFETHITGLANNSLRPALKILILALLPGLEEESSEDFGRVLKLLSTLREQFEYDGFFWQCFFLASITSRSRRTGAFKYLDRCLPYLGRPALQQKSLDEADFAQLSDEAERVVLPEPGLLIRCFAAGLEDEQVLLQRDFLDLLLTRLPLNSEILTDRADHADVQRLVRAAIAVVFRRDMSLNRRLWSWLLGPEANDGVSDTTSPLSPRMPKLNNAYFIEFGLQHTVNSILLMMETNQNLSAEMVKPFRICLSLMDRRELALPLIPAIFMQTMDSLYSYQNRAKDYDFLEVLRSARSFFDGIESRVIWGQMNRCLDICLSTSTIDPLRCVHELRLTRFIIDSFNVREDDMLELHIPLTCLLFMCRICQELASHHSLDGEVLKLSLSICGQLAALIVEGNHFQHANTDKDVEKTDEVIVVPEDIARRITTFYDISSNDVGYSSEPFKPKETAKMLLQQSASLLFDDRSDDSTLEGFSARASIFLNLLSKFPGSHVEPSVIHKVHQVLDGHKIPFPALMTIAQLLMQIAKQTAKQTRRRNNSISIAMAHLVEHLWEFLIPESAIHHVEAVKCIWQLHRIDRDIVESSITKYVLEGQMQAFATIWSLSGDNIQRVAMHRPLLLLLDHLDQRYSFAESWLRANSDVGEILDTLIPSSTLNAADTLSYLEKISHVIRISSENISISIAEHSSDTASEERRDVVIAQLCLRIIAKPSIGSDSTRLMCLALTILQQLLNASTSTHRSTSKTDASPVGTLVLEELLAVLPLFESQSHCLMVALLDTTVAALKTVRTGDSQQVKAMIECVRRGITLISPPHVLGKWIEFLTEILPLLETLFEHIIPLVESLCGQVRLLDTAAPPLEAIMWLLLGLERSIVTAHDALTNVHSIGRRGQNSLANARLTVLLCMQDAIALCTSLWAAHGEGSDHVSTKLRIRTRRLLDLLFSREPLECFEALIVAWAQKKPVMRLLHVLDTPQPERTFAVLFNSIYSRTNPIALERSEMSSLTSEIKDTDLGHFLVEYTRSLDDDAMDEIWTGCMTFLKDVLSNPLPQSHILPSLLQFLFTLAEKIERTNFGEQRKMRKELSDLFLRLLAANFATNTPQMQSNSLVTGTTDVVDTLLAIVPRLQVILAEPDKVITAVSSICLNVTSPIVHAKTFPDNIRKNSLDLLYMLGNLPKPSKHWRKDVTDLFNHPKLFEISLHLVQSALLPVLERWTFDDKERMVEILSRLTPPQSAGMLFGVGASTTRADADKRTQVTLKRVALLLLATNEDSIIPHLDLLYQKTSELFEATPASAPSSAIRPELFTLVRALVCKIDSIHLSAFWPTVVPELQKSLLLASPSSERVALPQACKLLEELLTFAPEGFQPYEWLFITNTIDAVYRPAPPYKPIALIDRIADEAVDKDNVNGHGTSGDTLELDLQTFCSKMSIRIFEQHYRMESQAPVNLESVIRDLFV